jgi:hypothetical protein
LRIKLKGPGCVLYDSAGSLVRNTRCELTDLVQDFGIRSRTFCAAHCGPSGRLALSYPADMCMSSVEVPGHHCTGQDDESLSTRGRRWHRDPGRYSVPGRDETGNGNRVEIHGVDVQLVGVEQQEADHFALADLRIRCGGDEPEGSKVVSPGYCRRPEPVDPGYRPARPN